MFCMTNDLNDLIKSKVTLIEDEKAVPWITEQKGVFKV